MHRPVRDPDFYLEVTAVEETCPTCGGPLHVLRHRDRSIQRLEGLLYLLRRHKLCPNQDCPNTTMYRAPMDLRLALPRMTFGLDVVLAVGDRHLRQRQSLSFIGRDLTAHGVPIDQTHVGRLLRVHVALEHCSRGSEEAVVRKLKAQGGIVVMADGVQHDSHEPPLYMVWDALSGTPLFGERREGRSKDDLVELLERVKATGVPVIATISDKETGLLPAIAEVFPDAPQQYCQTHFLKNCAEPLRPDLTELGESVKRRAKAVQKVTKGIRGRRRRAAIKTRKEDEQKKAPGAPVTEDALDAVVPPEICAPAPLRASTREPEPISKSEPSTVAPEATVASSAAAQKKPSEATVTVARVVPIDETELASKLCEIARENARRSAKAPLDPPELRRHEGLELVRAAVAEAIAIRHTAVNATRELQDLGGRQEAPLRSRPARESTRTRLARGALRGTPRATR